MRRLGTVADIQMREYAEGGMWKCLATDAVNGRDGTVRSCRTLSADST